MYYTQRLKYSFAQTAGARGGRLSARFVDRRKHGQIQMNAKLSSIMMVNQW